MALGDQYNNNKKNTDPVVYSRYGFSNPLSEVDQTRMGFSYWAGLLKITISPKKGETTEGYPEWDKENNISIYLPHTKAQMFRDIVKGFLADRDAYNNIGVDAGKGMISISNGKEFGINCPVITIKTINTNGEIVSSYAYQINQQYHFAIANFNEKKPSEYEKKYFDDLELEQLIMLLDEYIKAMTGAAAYSVIDNNKYNTSRTQTKLDSIAEKLGIEYKKGGSSKSSTSYFNSNNKSLPNNSSSSSSSSFSSNTLDDIDSMMDI